MLPILFHFRLIFSPFLTNCTLGFFHSRTHAFHPDDSYPVTFPPFSLRHHARPAWRVQGENARDSSPFIILSFSKWLENNGIFVGYTYIYIFFSSRIGRFRSLLWNWSDRWNAYALLRGFAVDSGRGKERMSHLYVRWHTYTAAAKSAGDSDL